MASYIAIIQKEPDSDYGVYFPDFPGCVTAGINVEEARRFAREALELHAAAMIEDGQALPQPTDATTLSSEFDPSRTVMLEIELPDPVPRMTHVNVSVPEPDLKAIDEYAEAHGLTRSGFLVEAAKAAMKRDEAELERRRA